MNKAYNRTYWKNYPSDETPLNEANLNKLEAATDEIDNRVVNMDASKATKTEVATTITDVSFNETTGVFTFTRKNGTTFTLNTALEKIATNFRYDYTTQTLILTLIDGTTQTIDLSALLTQYEFIDSGTINFEIDSSGKVKATIINGSITDSMLESGYLSKLTTQANNAQTNATKSQSYAVGGTGTRENEDTDNSKNYYEKSKEIFENIKDVQAVIDTIIDVTAYKYVQSTEGEFNVGVPGDYEYPEYHFAVFKEAMLTYSGDTVDIRDVHLCTTFDSGSQTYSHKIYYKAKTSSSQQVKITFAVY